MDNSGIGVSSSSNPNDGKWKWTKTKIILFSVFGVFLLILVWLYPLYTFLFNQLEVAFIGNLLTLWVTASYMQKLKKLPIKEHKWMTPQIVWIIIATIYVGCMLVEKYQMA